MSTTITTRLERRIEANPRGLTIIETICGNMIQAALTPDEARQIAVALTADAPMVSARPVSPEERGEFWARIRDELRREYPSATDYDHRKLDLAASASADAVVEYLNAHHPKPEQAMVPARPITRADLPDLHPWLTEGAIDQVIEHINDRGGLGIDAREPLERALRERDAAAERAEAAERVLRERDEQEDDATRAAVERAEQAEREVNTWRTSTESAHSDFLQAAHDRDEWKARAEALEAEAEEAFEQGATWQKARTAPAVTHADVEKALDTGIRGTTDGGLIDQDTSIPSGECVRLAVDAVCDLFGIEAEQDIDPVEAKARELYEVANPGVSWGPVVESAERGNGVDGQVAREYRAIARHVLGQEATR